MLPRRTMPVTATAKWPTRFDTTTVHDTQRTRMSHVSTACVGTGQARGREKEKKELGPAAQPPHAILLPSYAARILLASRAENAMGSWTVGCALKEPTTDAAIMPEHVNPDRRGWKTDRGRSPPSPLHYHRRRRAPVPSIVRYRSAARDG
jgi:hypothetical protein